MALLIDYAFELAENIALKVTHRKKNVALRMHHYYLLKMVVKSANQEIKNKNRNKPEEMK